MSDGYKVVPESLREMADVVSEVATEYEKLSADIRGHRLDNDALGLLGRLADVSAEYNGAVDEFSENLDTSARDTADGAESLRKAAEVYLAKDEEWWERFGYM